ncbi:MAG: CARDB domain-containing protein, partial [Chloroflexota bacterium]
VHMVIPVLPTYQLFLPMISRATLIDIPEQQPGLIISEVQVSSNDISVVIKNIGNVSATDDFWVDLYINPVQVPSYNIIWPTITTQGLVWGVTDSISPGESMTLTLNGPYYFAELSTFSQFRPGTTVWAQVDSANALTTYGGVLEGDETNNVFGPEVVKERKRITSEQILLPQIRQKSDRRSLPIR